MLVQAAPKTLKWKLLLLKVFDVLDYITNALQLLGLFVRNFMAKLFFQRHDQFHGIERISTQILDELGVGRDLVGVNAELLDDDVLDSLFYGFLSHDLLRF